MAEGVTGWKERVLECLVSGWRTIVGSIAPDWLFRNDFFRALEDGEGSTVFLWPWDGPRDYTADVQDLMADVDAEVRHAPAPFGADSMFIRVAAFGPRAQDTDTVECELKGRGMLRRESLFVDRYHDWLRGDARERLATLISRTLPTPEAPLTVVAIFPFGGAIASLLRSGKWRPASPWLR